MEVREGMSRVVLTVGPGHTLREAAKRMTDKGVGAAVVIDEETPGPRVVSERDVLNSLGRGEDPDAEREVPLPVTHVIVDLEAEQAAARPA